MYRIRKFVIDFITKGHERSVKAKKNILLSFIISVLSIAISLLLVPLTINYINPSRYGIWLTISSIVAWFSYFDIGLTQGLRNKLAEAKAVRDDYIAQVYISTTYALLGIIFSCIWIFFMILNFTLDWSKILNVSANMSSEISILAIIIFTYFCLSFVLRIINTILLADQLPAKSSFIDLLSQIISLIFILMLVRLTEGSLIKLGLALCISPLMVLIIANFFLFKRSYSKYRPLISKVDFSYAKSLFSIGIVFFVIQIANLLQFQTANIIIARSFSVSDVTSYNIVYKYFGILTMIFMIFLTPFWSASTEAYNKNDIQWIKNGIKKYNQLNIVMIILGCLMLIISDTVYNLWLGEGKVRIDFSLSLFGFIFFNTSIFGGKYVSFLNGISALRIQFISSIISPFIFFALVFLLVEHYRMGVHALFIAAIIVNFNTYLLAPIQYHQIMKGKKGIWIR